MEQPFKTIMKPIRPFGMVVYTQILKYSNVLSPYYFKSLLLLRGTSQISSIIHSDLEIRSVNNKIKNCSESYRNRLQVHPYICAGRLMVEARRVCRLKRRIPCNLRK